MTNEAKTKSVPVDEDGTGPYEMSISLNVLQHLGLNLYSNVPAVLSEVVANSYDADASRVDVTIDVESGTVVISDDGHGMTLAQINSRFLNVGFTRRTNGLATSPNGRQVMGRKGIGKLSLFSIADVVDVHTARDGERNSLRMSTEGIRTQLKTNSSEPYRPIPISTDVIDFEHGTRIVLRSLKKRLSRTSDALRTRLARRFSVLGDEAGFRLFVGGSEVTVTDRDYFHKLEFLWTFGSGLATADVVGRAKDARVFHAETVQLVPVDEDGTSVVGDEPFEVTGWIGTAKSTSALKDQRTGDNINKISLVLRGKLAHEDLMEEFNENGMYASYLIGEIHADFLDDDEEDDIATSSRQRIVEDDPRYRALVAWLKKTTTAIGRAWLAERDQGGRDRALHNELIAEWFKSLPRDQRKKAERLFGKINQLTVNREEERNALFAQAVIGFETLRYRDNLDAIDKFEPEDLRRLSVLFGDVADIQAALYRKIVRQRLEVIEKLREHVDANDLERVLQEHLYKNLWLLDPAWERAADHSMEERVSTAFKAIDAQLTSEEAASRIDIRYKRTGGTNVIVELKRASVLTDALTLLQQIDKYQNALRKYLRDIQRPELIEVVCVLGRYPQAWLDTEVYNQEVKMLAAKGARIVLYETLLADAESSYREYLEADTEAGRIATLIEGLAAHADDDELVSGEVSDIAPAGVR